MSQTVLGRVLVVDDEFPLMDALVEALNAQGYEAKGFQTGVAAIEALQKQEFDLLLTDLMMPGMDGITLLKACTAIDSNLVGILMTGQGTVPTAVEAMKTGAFDYILKPFRLDALLPVLARAIEMRQLRLENIQLRETVTIYNLSQTVAYSLDSKLVLENTADAALQQTSADEVSIMLFKPDNNELYISVVRGKNREHLLGQPISMQEGIAGWVARHFEPLILNGEVTDPRFAPIQPRLEIRSAISMPMLTAGKLIGILNVNSLQARQPFAPGQVKALSVLTSTAAAALENESLFNTLEAREKRFRALTENAPDGITVVDQNGIVIYVSPSVERILGYSQAEALGRPAIKYVHSEDSLQLLEQVARLVKKPGHALVQYRFRHKDGSWRWLESTVSNFIGDPGIEAIVFNYRDITERKQAEEQLRYQAYILSNVNDAIIATDENYQIAYWNHAAETLYGWSAEDVIGKFGPEITKTEFPGIDADEMLLHIRETGLWRGEVTQVKKDGTRFPCEISSLLLRDDSDNITGYVSINRDIAERKQAEEALQKSEERYRFLFENNPLPMWVYDLKTLAFLAVNDWAVEKYGYTREEFLHMSIADIRPSEEVSRLMEDVSKRRPALQRSGEWRHRLKNGTIIDVEISSHTLQIDGHDAALVVAQDITEREQAEQTLQEKERLLSEAQRIGHIGSWRYDIFQDILQYSDEMYRLLDVSPKDFKHNREGFLNVIYSSDQPKVAKWMDRIKAGRQVGELDFLIFLKTGELRYIHCRGAVEFDTKGIPAHFIGTGQDITERKLAELQIHQQLEYLNALRRIDQAITSSFNLLPTLEIALSQVISQLQVDAADILLLDTEAQMLEYVAGQGFRTQVVETSRVPVGESFAGRAVKERRLIRIENLKDQSDTALRSTLAAGEGFISYFGVPLLTKGKVKGVLEVFHRGPLQPYPEWLDFLETLAGQAAIAIDNATLFENLQQSNQELMHAYDATIEGWSRAMDLRDKETEGHTQRVTDLTLRLAGVMNMRESDLVQIRRGALLHDMGKLGVPDSILLKPGKLTDEEWEIMRKHPQFAYDMLSSISYLKSALNIPYCHHEKWDGTGYPRGLKSEQIPVEARLFSVVDVWDALTSDRPYRKAWSKEEAAQYIGDQSGKHFDPKVVDIFLNTVAKM